MTRALFQPGQKRASGDPEGPLERGEPRPRLPLSVDGELLPQGQLDNGLLLATPKEAEEASEDRD